MQDPEHRPGHTNYDWINGMRVGIIVGGILGMLIGLAIGWFPRRESCASLVAHLGRLAAEWGRRRLVRHRATRYSDSTTLPTRGACSVCCEGD